MEAERLACWFNSLSLCNERYPFLAKRIDTSLILPHAEGKLWIKDAVCIAEFLALIRTACT